MDLFISSPPDPTVCVMFCNICITPEQLISQSISVSASGGESYRGQFAEIRNAALSSPEAEYWYIITLSRGPGISCQSPLSPHSPPPVLGSRTSVRDFPVVPMLPRLPSAGCGAGSGPRIRTHQYLQPRTWRGNSGRSQSILQRKLRISQDMCRPWHRSVPCAASTQ